MKIQTNKWAYLGPLSGLLAILVLTLGAPSTSGRSVSEGARANDEAGDKKLASNLLSRSLPTRLEGTTEDKRVQIGNAIEPVSVRILVGHTVIWQNQSQQDIKIKFRSHGLSTFCREPDGFVLGVDGIRSSNRLKPGEIASLCFLEPREFGYVVEGADGGGALVGGNGQPMSGVIQVFETH